VTRHAEQDTIARLLGQPVTAVREADWGFQNRTDIVTLAGGERVVLQRYRRRADAEQRVRVAGALHAPAAAAAIAIPAVRSADPDATPPWALFELLPGEPVPAHDAIEPLAPKMGELLAAFRALPARGLELDDLWASPERLAAAATEWAAGRPEVGAVIADVPALFSGRPSVLAHGDFAPVNVLTDGRSITGLLDFESIRLADPLFDAAWWAWSVSFASPQTLAPAWPRFLTGAGLEDDERRVHVLQVLRMLELLAGPTLGEDVRRRQRAPPRGLRTRRVGTGTLNEPSQQPAIRAGCGRSCSAWSPRPGR
jgi:aminoglycoside phosphotransferase (APT) family kinase protein